MATKHKTKPKKDPAVVYKAALESMGATSVWQARADVPREAAILKMVNEISHYRHVETPPVLIYESDKPNAVSMPGAVAVATNLIDITTPNQLKAVLGHEMSHTRHRWRDVPIIITIVTAAHMVISTLMDKVLQHVRPKNMVTKSIAVVAEEVVPYAGALLAMKPYGMHMEYEADREGAEVAGANNMGGALQALSQRVLEIKATEPPPSWLARVAHKTGTLFFDIHPPMRSRLERMERLDDKQQEQQAAAGIHSL